MRVDDREIRHLGPPIGNGAGSAAIPTKVASSIVAASTLRKNVSRHRRNHSSKKAIFKRRLPYFNAPNALPLAAHFRAALLLHR
jgi:hypothetical protein